MSNLLDTYLTYVAKWQNESEANIDSIINEYYYFQEVDDFESDSAINEEFAELVQLATDARNATVAADALRIAADAAAVAAVWSFGASMAVFSTAQATAVFEDGVASTKAGELNNKLKTADTDISAKIDTKVDTYVKQYKANNELLSQKADSAVDGAHARAILLRFLATVHLRSGQMNVGTFREYAAAASEVLQDTTSIQTVYDALDNVNLDGKNSTDAEITALMDSLSGLQAGKTIKAMHMVKGLVFPFMFYNLKITNTRIKTFAEEAGLTVEELGVSTLDAMNAVGKVSVAVSFMVVVLDVMFQIWDIVDVVQQTSKMVDELDGSVKQGYKDFFDGIKHAAKEYKLAIQEADLSTIPSTSTSASYTGEFYCNKYKNSVHENDWHDVNVTMYLSNKFKWTNKAGVSWTMTKDRSNPLELTVGTDCPYYKYGYTVATYSADYGYVTGPWNEKYYRVTSSTDTSANV